LQKIADLTITFFAKKSIFRWIQIWGLGHHELVILSGLIDWDYFESEFSDCYCLDNGRAAISIRMKVGLTILQSIYNLSDEAVVEDWVRDPYFQYFCGEEFFLS